MKAMKKITQEQLLAAILFLAGHGAKIATDYQSGDYPDCARQIVAVANAVRKTVLKKKNASGK